MRPWTDRQAWSADGDSAASMGPRPCGRGRPGRHIRCRRPFRASMGPRPCGRGRLCEHLLEAPPIELQWGHGLAAVDGKGSATRWVEVKSFNGATALRPWTGQTARPQRAATALQWGHGLAAVDGTSLNLSSQKVCKASMGPRPCGRGRRCARPRHAAEPPPLQWGHGLAAVDGPARLPVARAATMLQWGHGLAAVDGMWGTLSSCRGAPASMGPRPCGRGRHCWVHHLLVRSGSFNGATALRPWTAANIRPPARLGRASMGPRPCGRGRCCSWPAPARGAI